MTQIAIETRIDLESPMRRAWKAGLGYIPSIRGENLEQETGDAGVMLRNAQRLLELELKVLYLLTAPGRSILIVFESGEEYLASGFRLGDPKVAPLLAQFVVQAGLDSDVKQVTDYLTALPDDLEGPIKF